MSTVILALQPPGAGWLVGIAWGGAVIIYARCLFRLLTALGTPSAALWVIAAFIPLVAFVQIMLVNEKATTVLMSAGIQVGLLGAQLADGPPPAFWLAASPMLQAPVEQPTSQVC